MAGINFINENEYSKPLKLNKMETIKNYDHINNFDLRSDIENDNLPENHFFKKSGLVDKNTFAIDCMISEHECAQSYLYQSFNEYFEDIKILGI